MGREVGSIVWVWSGGFAEIVGDTIAKCFFVTLSTFVIPSATNSTIIPATAGLTFWENVAACLTGCVFLCASVVGRDSQYLVVCLCSHSAFLSAISPPLVLVSDVWSSLGGLRAVYHNLERVCTAWFQCVRGTQSCVYFVNVVVYLSSDHTGTGDADCLLWWRNSTVVVTPVYSWFWFLCMNKPKLFNVLATLYCIQVWTFLQSFDSWVALSFSWYSSRECDFLLESWTPKDVTASL